MTSTEFIEDYPVITRKHVIRILAEHGVNINCGFIDEFGDKEEYSSQDVFNWLGY